MVNLFRYKQQETLTCILEQDTATSIPEQQDTTTSTSEQQETPTSILEKISKKQ